MIFDWNSDVIRWYTDADEYTGFSGKLAALLRPKLAGCRTLCDIGCGLGLTDFALAPFFDSVTCADISPEAIAYIRDRCAAEGITSIRPVCADGPSLQGSWDAVTAMFHGQIEVIVPNYLKKARDRLVLVVHGSASGTTGPEGYRVRKCCSMDAASAWLDAHGYRYSCEYAELEFGQPHRSLEEAVAYTRTNTVGTPEDLLRKHVERTVLPTGDERFPLYTPKTKRFGIYVIRKADGPQTH